MSKAQWAKQVGVLQAKKCNGNGILLMFAFIKPAVSTSDPTCHFAQLPQFLRSELIFTLNNVSHCRSPEALHHYDKRNFKKKPPVRGCCKVTRTESEGVGKWLKTTWPHRRHFRLDVKALIGKMWHS